MKELSRATVKRLPRYYRCLRNLIQNDVLRVSSGELADLVGLSASQVRGDLCGLGELGQQGYGYSVRRLYTEIAARLGTGDNVSAVVIGATPLGYAAACGVMLSKRGVKVEAVFYTGDIEPSHPPLPDGCAFLPVAKLGEYGKRDIAVLSCDDTEVPELYRLIADAGFGGIWNLTEIELRPSDIIRVVNARLSDSLMTLCYALHGDE